MPGEGGKSLSYEEALEAQRQMVASLPKDVLADAANRYAEQVVLDNYKKAQAAGRRAAEQDRAEELAAQSGMRHNIIDEIDVLLGDKFLALPSGMEPIETLAPVTREQRIESASAFLANTAISNAA